MSIATSFTHPIRAADAIDSAEFARVRRRMMLDCCKWDPQVGDISTLAAFPLLIERHDWNELVDLAESLTAELLSAERELIDKPQLHRVLAAPRAIRSVLRQCDPSPAAVRVMRFDFHWTRDGWKISEVNSDVPGGFSEASEFTRLMSEHLPGTTPPGDPATIWTEAISHSAQGDDIALLAAPGFMEDQQVVAYLAKKLSARGFRTHLAQPRHLEWNDGRAAWRGMPLGAIVRFYQAEWLKYLPRRFWKPFFTGGCTPLGNPGIAVLSESKRFPLVWDMLKTPLPTWRRLLPESLDPRDVPWRRDDAWLIKTAYCNNGDSVTARDTATPKQWRAAALSAWLRPDQWIAQHRFEPLPVATPMGDVFPCIGVFTIDGRAAGAYTRIASRRVIDYRAIDAALLVTEDRYDG